MKLFSAALFALAVLSVPLSASVCPTTAYTNSDCGFVITVGAGGTLTNAVVPNASPYDGSDDTLVGVVNNSGAVFNGPITLMGSGDGGGLFAFEGDGICSYISAAYCSTASTGYEGPLSTFTNISTTTDADDTGTILVSGLAAGASTYFSLESSPASIDNGSGPTVLNGGSPAAVGSAPEPGSISLLGAGLAAFVVYCKRRKA